MPDPIPPTGNNNSPTVKFGAGAWALVIGLTLISFFIFHIDFYPAAVGSLVIVYLFLQGNRELKAQRPGNSTQEADPSNTSTSEQSAQIAFEFESAPASPASIVPQEPARETAATAAQSVVLSKPRSVKVGKVLLMVCLLPTGILAGLLVFGMSLVHYVQTKNVDYSDVLTTYNDHVFQQHHSWSDSGVEKGNTDAAEMAMARLGHAAYGKTFRDLIDGEKREEKKIAKALATATTTPTDSPETAVPATATPPSAAPDLLDRQPQAESLGEAAAAGNKYGLPTINASEVDLSCGNVANDAKDYNHALVQNDPTPIVLGIQGVVGSLIGCLPLDIDSHKERYQQLADQIGYMSTLEAEVDRLLWGRSEMGREPNAYTVDGKLESDYSEILKVQFYANQCGSALMNSAREGLQNIGSAEASTYEC